MRHGPLAPSTSHSSSALSILSPCDTVRSLPPHLIQAQSCPFFLHATRSARSLHISFKLSPARSFSMRHGPLAPSTSHSSSVLPVLSPCDTVRSLPPHLIQAQSCLFFLHATRSARSLHISFKLSPACSFSMRHGPLAPSTSHSSSVLPVLSPCDTVRSLPPHLIQAQSCPFFLHATRSARSLHISFKLSPACSFSMRHGPLAPSTSHSSSVLPVLSPCDTVRSLPPHLIQAQSCPFFLHATRSARSLHISFKLSPARSFSMRHGPLAPPTSHSSSVLPVLSPCDTVRSLPPHLIQAQSCLFFLHATRSARSLHISFKLSPARSFSMRHGPLAPSTSHSSSVLPVLSPCDTVRSLPPHLIQAQSCLFFLHATRSARSLHISFKLSPARSFSMRRGPLAPSTSHSSSVLPLPLHCPTTFLLAFSVIFCFVKALLVIEGVVYNCPISLCFSASTFKLNICSVVDRPRLNPACSYYYYWLEHLA